MKGRTPTADERRFMNSLCSLGCIVCRLSMSIFSPCTVHHIDGKTKPGAHYHILGLCGNHHQVPDTQKPKRWVARHENKTEFEKLYGTEQSLYLTSLELLENNGVELPESISA